MNENGKPTARTVVLSARVDAESYDGFRHCLEVEGQTVSGSIRDAIESAIEAARVRRAAAEAAAEKKSQEWPWWWPIAATFAGLALARFVEGLNDKSATSRPVGYGRATRLLRRDLHPPGSPVRPSSDGRDGGDSSAGATVADGTPAEV